MYYEVPLFDYLNLARLRLLLAILAWEAKVVGEGNQGVWATCLIQCLNVLPKIFFKTIHPSAFKKNFQGRKNLELDQLLKDFAHKKQKVTRENWPIPKAIMVM